jgi:four helix bundle suffix protein
MPTRQEANAIICLIHQENYLLDHQVEGLEGQFVEGGGYSERLAAARLARRQNRRTSDMSDPTDPSDQTDPTSASPVCPACGLAMVLRTARKGPKAGSQFWGCSGYPECRRTLPV